MNSYNINLQQIKDFKQKLVQHIENRQSIKKMYADKGIQILDNQELLIQDMQDPNLNATLNNIYIAMKNELSQKGYRDFRYLGQGAQGLVVLAQEQFSNKRFAIKGIRVKDSQGNIDQNTLKQVNQEIEILNKCKGSPYVVNFVGKIEGSQYVYLILTECLGTLNQIILRNPNRRLNELSAIKYGKDIAEGLCFIHSKNCLVNDLKMDNILIDYNGNAVVSDFGLANHLPKQSGQSGYSVGLYMRNAAFQAPECYDPQEFDTYSLEYQQLGIAVKREPSQISEACSLGYLIYAMISGLNPQLIFNKHNPLQYGPDFQNFTYKKQLQYIIDGLTQFIPRNRFQIKDILIILKGIISLEFSLESKFVELMEAKSEVVQQLIQPFQQQMELVQHFEDKFYPIFENENNMLQQLVQEIQGNDQYQQDQIIKGLKKEIESLKNTMSKQQKEIAQQKSMQQNIQPIIQNQQANTYQVFSQQALIQQNEMNQEIVQQIKVQNNKKNSDYFPKIFEDQMIFDEQKKKIGYIERLDFDNAKEIGYQNIPLFDWDLNKEIGKISLIFGKEIIKFNKNLDFDWNKNYDANLKLWKEPNIKIEFD